MKEIEYKLRENRNKIRFENSTTTTNKITEALDPAFYIRYSYDGDSISDYANTIMVRANTEEEAIKKARERILSRYPEKNPHNFHLDTSYGNKGIIGDVTKYKSEHPNSNMYDESHDTDEEPTTIRPVHTNVSTELSEETQDYSEDLSDYEDAEEDDYDPNEEEEEEEDEITLWSDLQRLSGEWWTRMDELVTDIEDLGYEVVYQSREYLIITDPDSGSDEEYKLALDGTERTLVLDFDSSYPV